MKLIASVLVIAFLGLGVAGATTLTSLHSYLIHRVDGQLSNFGDGAGPGFESNGGYPPNGAEQGGTMGAPRLPTEFYIDYYTTSGVRFGHYGLTVGNQAPPQLPSKLTAASVRSHLNKPYTVSSTSGDNNWRVLISYNQNTGFIQATALSLADVDSTVNHLLWLEIGIGIAVLLLMAGAGYFVVRRSLRPLTEVEATAGAIAGGDLSRRIPDADERTEVGRLSLALNGMLAQIETAFDKQAMSEQQAHATTARMRQFIADASHELRTPLTSIRGFSELYRMGAVSDAEELSRLMSRIETEAARMGVLVEDLLLLARLDQQRPMEHQPVDLLAVAGDATHDARAVAPDRKITLETPSGVPAIVVGDEARLRQVAHNLISNALSHTPSGTSVTVRLSTDGTNAVLEVADEGPGLTPEQAEHVFERFYRVDSARTRDAGGAGLGLAIVSEIVASHDGEVTVSSTPGEGAVFTVRLPLAAALSKAHSQATAAAQDQSSELRDNGRREVNVSF